jgi:hypothetical protein
VTQHQARVVTDPQEFGGFGESGEFGNSENIEGSQAKFRSGPSQPVIPT